MSILNVEICVLAEATNTFASDKSTVDDTEDNLRIGVNQFERRATPCEYAAALLDVPDALAMENYKNVTVFSDLFQHELFVNHALVNEHPHGTSASLTRRLFFVYPSPCL